MTSLAGSVFLLANVLAFALAEGNPASQRSAEPALCKGTDSLGIHISFFDVGQGAAALLTASDGRNIMIDGGASRQLVTTLVRARKVKRIDLLIATHNHADHIGGLPMLVSSVPVSNVIENGLPATTTIYRDLMSALTSANVRGLEPTARTLTLGATAVRVLPPLSRGRSQNDRSVGAVVSYGAFSAVFTGDAETASLGGWLASERIPQATVVLAGHHGSSNATTPAWVTATSPALVVISSGTNNSYGHPDRRTIAMWAAPERSIARTDRDGTIEVRGCRDGSFYVTRQGRAR